MKKEEKKQDRREFLKRSAQAFVVVPAAVTSLQHLGPEEEATQITEELSPGDPGYRDPGEYGSISE